MVKVSDLKSASQIAEEEIRANPAIRREVERTALANTVAIRVIEYRADHDLSQTQLARQLGMHQSAIARLEAGDHEPSLSTLARLAKGLGIDFRINITSDGRIELDSAQQQEQPEQRDVFQLLLEYVEENIRAQQRSWETIAQALASHQSLFLRNLESRPALQAWLLGRLKANRAYEQEDSILEELDRLLHDEKKDDETHQNTR